MTGTSETIVSAGEAQREHERIALAALTAHIFERALDVPHTIAIDRYGQASRSPMNSSTSPARRMSTRRSAGWLFCWKPTRSARTG